MQHFGVDVSSKWLDIADDSGEVVRIDNTIKAIKKWLCLTKESDAIAMEATSSYHKLLASLAHNKKLDVYVINPRIIHHYAKGVGRRGKSDKVDAIIIHRYLTKERELIHHWQPLSKEQEMIDTLLNRRRQVIKQKQALEMACKDICHIVTEVLPTIKALEKLADQLETMVVSKIKQQEFLKNKFNILLTVPGVGPLTGAYMLNLLEKKKITNIDQLTSFIGLDLTYKDSGAKQSRRHLSKQGASEARRLLFNGSRSASMSQLKPLYESYRTRMNHTQSIVAVMRKVLKLILGVWKSQTPFDFKKYQTPLMNKA